MNVIVEYKNYYLLAFFFVLLTKAQSQDYPFVLPENITASLNVNSSSARPFNNKIIGYNIQGFDTQLQKDFINLVDPVTIRFPHGVWANFYKWQTDGYQDDAYDNREHEEALQTFVCCISGDINGIADLNNQKKNRTGGQGYDMMWTYSINFDDGASSVARAQKDIGLGLEVKAVELGNEHFWKGQRSLRTETPEMFLTAATEVSSALKSEFPNIKLSLPLSWRRNHEDYNNTIKGDGNFFDAISLHKYINKDPVSLGSNNAYSDLLTAKLELQEDADWVRSFAPGKPIWLTEWGISSGDNLHAAACLGIADVYLFLAENEDAYERANWFIFNRVANSMVVVGSNREPIYPLQKKGNLLVYEIIQDVFRDANIMEGEVIASAQLTVSRGSVNVVNARATTNEFGETKVVAVNLTDKPVTFELKFDDVVYSRSFKHEALIFDNLGEVDPIDYFSNPMQLVKEGTGAITLPPLSVSKISKIYFDESIHLIPGTIEAEDYKDGGEGIGFSDTTADNTLSTGIDTDGVDVGTDGGITYVGDTQNGEWLKYDVNVLNADDYDFEFVYASDTAGALVSIEIDDVVVFDNFSLPQTAGATDFQTASKLTVPLAKGLHELKLNVQNGGFNLDKINVQAVPIIEAPLFVTPNDLDNIEPGNSIEVEASTTSATVNIASLELFINDILVRSIASAPFTWGYSGQNDALLENIAEGTYSLKLVLTDDRGRTKENTITVTSTNYPTRPFLGTAHIVPGVIQTEDYDLGGSGFAFWDSSVGNSGGAYRTDAGDDVDITLGGTGFVTTGLSGNEYMRYTINVTESGRYEMLVNYATYSTTSKPFAAYLLPKDLSTSDLLFSAPNGSTINGIRKINGGGDFQDYASDEFDLNSGIWLLELRIPSGGAGPRYDYITLNRLGSLGVNEFEVNKTLKVYPIPSNDGKFKLSKSVKWEVYSILGMRVISGTGTSVNLSQYAKGIYVLKTEGGITKKIIYK